MRIVAAALALVFAVSAAVQWNDPDPLPWIAIYGAAAVLSGAFAARRTPAPWLSAVVALAAAAWSLSIAPRVVGRVGFAELWTHVGMKTVVIEEGREAVGLAVVAVAMAALAIASRRAG